MSALTFTPGQILTAAELTALAASLAQLDPATGKLPLTAVPDATNLSITAAQATANAALTEAQEAAAMAATAQQAAAQAAAAGSGLTPPLAAQFTYWFRQSEPVSVSAVSPGGPSFLVDVPGVGMDIDYQTRTNDVWSIRFVGTQCPVAPFELIASLRPSDIGYSPFWMCGPCLMNSSSLRGVWSKFVIGRDQPLCYAECDLVTFPADQSSSTQFPAGGVGGPGAWSRAHFLQRVWHRMVFDAAGYVTVFQSSVGKAGPWRILYSDKLDTSFGSPGSGTVADKIGFAVSGLQEGTPLLRQHALSEHWDLHAYTGPNQPTS